MNETQSESLQKPAESAQPTGIARRRLLRAGMAAGPVLLAVSGRSAMASTCAKGLSPLAWNSLAPDGVTCRLVSHTVEINSLGVSHGNWKPNGNNKLSQPWPATCIPFTGYTSGAYSNGGPNPDWASGTKFKDIFNVNAPGVYPESTSGIRNKSVSKILLDDNGTIESQLCAAYLNAKTIDGYAMTLGEVQQAYEGKVGSLTLSSGNMQVFLKQTWI